MEAEAPASATVWKTLLLASGRCWFTFQVRHMTSRCSLRSVSGASASQASLHTAKAPLFRRVERLLGAFVGRNWLQERLTQDPKVQAYSSVVQACSSVEPGARHVGIARNCRPGCCSAPPSSKSCSCTASVQ